jgi:hypothetical protein
VASRRDPDDGSNLDCGRRSLVLAPRLAAAEYWRYETESGSIAFTDDPKSIPAKYRESAKAVKAESLFDYDRLSVVEPIRPAPAPAAAGTAPVPVFPWPVERAAEPRRDVEDRVSLDVGGMRFDLEADEDEPITVERRQYTRPDGSYFEYGGITAPTTVIRRGDKPIAYIDERE